MDHNAILAPGAARKARGATIGVHTAMPRFDQEAPNWDQEQRRVKLAQDVAAAIVAAAAPAARDEALDFGCGTGLVTLELAPLVASITGADASAGMLRELEQKIAARKLPGVRTLQLDPEALQLPRAAFDLAVSSMTFHHVKDTGALLAQLFSALRPGGRIAVADLDSDGGKFHPPGMDDVYHNGFARAALAAQFEAAGFAEVAARQAAEVTRPVDGAPRTFTIFLLTARKPA